MEYEVLIDSRLFHNDSVHAAFSKRGLAKGVPRVEILANGQIVKE